MSPHDPQRIFSGIQPTGTIHLGNYLGAIKTWLSFQGQQETLFCIVDLHALTTGYPNPEVFQRHIRLTAACYLACGINPAQSSIFVQSQVSEHTELAWILGCLTPLGWLNRMTQFKDKAGKNREGVGLGLYAYPVLMAADVLLYKATHVPVGADQKQHLELARDIAGLFNRQVGKDFFPLPEPCILGQTARVMSLRDGTAKMSKSDPNDFSRLNLFDDAELLAQKVRKAKTDSLPIPESEEELEGRPEAINLLSIYADLTENSLMSTLQTFKGQNFSSFKSALLEVVVAKICPIGKETQRLIAEKTYLDEVLKKGAEKATDLAGKNLQQVKEILGTL